MRLIDAEKLREEFLGMPNCYNGFSDTYDKAMIVDMVDEQPTVDAVPVVHGHWIQTEIIDDDDTRGINDEAAKCSNCEQIEPSFYWAKTYYHYCPNCGAKMDKEEKQCGKVR